MAVKHRLLWPSLFILTLSVVRPPECPAQYGQAFVDSFITQRVVSPLVLERENQVLKEQLSRLEARREAFRWGVFSDALVLRSGSVMQAQVAPDGRLVLATDTQGAVFFNGVVFEVLDRQYGGLPDDFVTAVAPVSKSSAYIATGTGLAFYQNGIISALPGIPPQLQKASISSLAALGEKVLWAGTQGLGLWRRSDNRWTNLRAGSDSSDLSHDNVSCLLAEPSSGRLWVGTAGGGVCLFSNGNWRKFKAPLGPGSEEVYCLTIDSDGLVWVGTVGAGAGIWAGGSWRPVELPLPGGYGVVSIVNLDGGDLFFGTTEGAFIHERATNSWNRLPLPEELSLYPVTAACEAHHRLWLSPSGQGLHIYDRGIITRFLPENGLPHEIVYRIAQSRDGRIWCATWSGIGIYDGRGWIRLGRGEGLPHELTTFVLFAGDGTAYLGTHGGVARLSQGRMTFFSRENGLASNTINHLALDSQGRVWISTEGGGLAVLEGDSLRLFRAADGLPADQVQVSAPSPGGDVWVGTKSGLALIRKAKVILPEHPAQEPCPGPVHVTDLCWADGELWAATFGNGLWKLGRDNQWQQFTVENGLSSNEVLCIAPGQQGRMWFGTSLGLSLFDGSHWRTYGTREGLEAGAVRAVLRAADGSLWLGVGENGVMRFDLAGFDSPETLVLTPSGRLTGFDIEDRRIGLVAAADSSGIRAAVDTTRGRLVVDGAYYFPALSAPEADTIYQRNLTVECLGFTPWWPVSQNTFRFSYKLDNGPWSEFSYQKLVSLYGLERGFHMLSLRAKDSNLKIDPTAAIVRFYVDVPTIWSDWRAWAGLVLLLLTAGGLVGHRQILWHLARLRQGEFKPITPNPFNPGAPATETERFVGRSEVLQTIEETISGEDSGHASIIVSGQEKIGVSSVLLQVAERVNTRGGSAFYLDLSTQYFPDISSLLEHIGSRLAVLTEKTMVSESGKRTVEVFRSRVAAARDPVVLVLDSAELLGRLIMRDPVLSQSIEAAFRQLVISDIGCSFVFGVRGLETFREQLVVLYNMSRIFRLTQLSEEAAGQMITVPLKHRALMHDEALAAIIRLTRGHPYLVNYLGRELVEQINRERTNLCTPETVERTVERLLANPPEMLLDRWEMLNKTEKLLLSAVASVAIEKDKPAELSVADLAGILHSHRVPVMEEELSKSAASLADREMARLDPSSGKLSVPNPLLIRWIAANQPVEVVHGREDYDFGQVVRKLGEELTRAFRVEELAGRMLSEIHHLLRLEWGALLTAAPAGASGKEPVPLAVVSAVGQAEAAARIPSSLPVELLELLTIKGEAMTTEELGVSGADQAQDSAFSSDTLLVPFLAHGSLLGLLALGPRDGGQRYTRRDRMLLETVAEQAAVALENARLYEEETEKERLKQELETARRMQMAILPERSPDIPELDIAACFTPATEVGGDYYDYILIDDSTLALIIGDVSGHGISAGTMVYMAKSCIYNQIKTSYAIDQVMEAMNDMVHGTVKERLLMTFCYSIFDLKKSSFSFSNAGHPFPYHYHAGQGRLEELELSAYPLGVSSKTRYTSVQTGYSSGDVLVFYSDGIVEGTDKAGEQYGFERFQQQILKYKDLGAEQIIHGIIGDYRGFAGGSPQADDITLVVIKVK